MDDHVIPHDRNATKLDAHTLSTAISCLQAFLPTVIDPKAALIHVVGEATHLNLLVDILRGRAEPEPPQLVRSLNAWSGSANQSLLKGPSSTTLAVWAIEFLIASELALGRVPGRAANSSQRAALAEQQVLIRRRLTPADLERVTEPKLIDRVLNAAR